METTELYIFYPCSGPKNATGTTENTTSTTFGRNYCHHVKKRVQVLGRNDLYDQEKVRHVRHVVNDRILLAGGVATALSGWFMYIHVCVWLGFGQMS